MKTTPRLPSLLLLLALSSGYAQQITTPYNFPIKPGMAEWKELQSQEDMIAACQIPVEILNNLTTEALAETCLNFPIFLQITAYNNVQNGFERFAEKFNGFSELLSRSDAGQVLLTKYISMNPTAYSRTWTNIEKGNFIFDFLYIEMLLSQKEILASLSMDSRKTLANECLKKYEAKLIEKDLFGLVGLGHTAFIMSNLLSTQNDKGFLATKETNERVKVFHETALLTDFETMTRIRELTTAYASTK
jgi:hypothetical protein